MAKHLSPQSVGQPVSETPPVYDPTIARAREYIAGGLALVIVVGAVAMMILAFLYVDAPDNNLAFARVKDLLLFINPLLGVVLGYYFNKVSTEARAERAEQSATTAAGLASQAALARDRAQAAVQDAQTVVTEHKLVLSEVSTLSRQLLQRDEGDPAVLGVAEPADDDALRRELRDALERARRLTQAP
jgi:hypothetical protein